MSKKMYECQGMLVSEAEYVAWMRREGLTPPIDETPAEEFGEDLED